MSLDEAVRLNNDAIALLTRSVNDNEIQESNAQLTKALRSFKSLLVAQEDQTRTKGQSYSMSQTLGRRLASVVDCPCSSEQDAPQVSNYIVNRMFHLFPTSDISVPNTLQIYISCVLFNLALLHQHQATTTHHCNRRRGLLERSSLLYQSCSQILRNISLSAAKGVPSVIFDHVILLLKVGSLNNSAQIHYECDEYEQASERLTMVESILCIQGLAGTQCCFTEQEFEGVLSNVFLLKPPTVAVAA